MGMRARCPMMGFEVDVLDRFSIRSEVTSPNNLSFPIALDDGGIRASRGGELRTSHVPPTLAKRSEPGRLCHHSPEASQAEPGAMSPRRPPLSIGPLAAERSSILLGIGN